MKYGLSGLSEQHKTAYSSNYKELDISSFNKQFVLNS